VHAQRPHEAQASRAERLRVQRIAPPRSLALDPTAPRARASASHQGEAARSGRASDRSPRARSAEISADRAPETPCTSSVGARRFGPSARPPEALGRQPGTAENGRRGRPRNRLRARTGCPASTVPRRLLATVHRGGERSAPRRKAAGAHVVGHSRRNRRGPASPAPWELRHPSPPRTAKPKSARTSVSAVAKRDPLGRGSCVGPERVQGEGEAEGAQPPGARGGTHATAWERSRENGPPRAAHRRSVREARR
jgi:hypothetical protein